MASWIEYTARRTLRRAILFGQRDEFCFVAWDGVEPPLRPFLLGRLDPLEARGDEVPPDVARALHRRATEQHEPCVGFCPDGNCVAGPQHEQLGVLEGITCHLDLARYRIERAFLVG